MRVLRTGSTLWILVAFASVLARPASGAPILAVEGPRVMVDGDLPSAKALERARDVVEATLVLAEKRLPYRLPPSERVVVHLHTTESSYADGMRMKDEQPKVGPSRTDPKSHESRVLVLPRADAAYLALVDDLPELARYLIAYETVAQVLQRADAPSFERWPRWYVHGICDTIASDAISPPDGPRPILVDDDVSAAHEAAITGRLLPLARLLSAHDLGIDGYRRYQPQWTALHRVLAKDAERYARLHETIRRLPVLPPPPEGMRDRADVGTAKAVAKVLEDVYGPLASLDAALAAYASALDPRRFDVLRWSQGTRDALICAPPPGSTAILVEEAALPGGPFSISCDVFIHDTGRRQGELYLAYGRRDDPRFVKLALLTEPAHEKEPDRGFVTLLAYSDGAWQDRLRVNTAVPPETFAPGRWISVRLDVRADRLRLEVDGKELTSLAVPYGFDVLSGRLGFGAFSEIVRFRKIVVAPLPPDPK